MPRRALLLFTLLVPSLAWAHARLRPDSGIKPRSNDDGLKVGPCGGVPKGAPQLFRSGQSVEVRWEETIQHPGWYEFRFSPDGLDFTTLLKKVDDTQDKRNDLPHLYSTTLVLPDVECDSCVLQFIQVMTDRTPPTNYYSCGDIKLTRSAPAVATPGLAVPQPPVPAPTALAATPSPTPVPSASPLPTPEANALPKPSKPKLRWVEERP